MRVRAAVLAEPTGPFTLEEIELDAPRDGEVLVRVAGTGMCHTDMVTRLAPGVSWGLPMVFGHEGSGVVEAVGRGVSSLRPGDRVVLTFDSCGTCPRCRIGEPAYCHLFAPLNNGGTRTDGTPGAHRLDGDAVRSRWFGQSSFATYALATERNAVKIDDVDLPLEMLGPLGCGVQTGAGSILVAMGVRPGETVAIFGAGAVGLSAVMAARLAGATTIIAVDLHAHRRDLAMELGATHTLDGADPDVAARIRDLTGGGVLYSFETTGAPAVIRAAVASLQIRGFCGLVGIGREDIVLSPQALGGGRSLSYLLEGNVEPHIFIPRLLELWRQGRFPFDRLIRTYPLAQINEAEADSAAGRTVKPVLLPG
ncbi:NAD(P)-dependent alcohol dehydrogenase [Pseudonocardia ailaonensis]|uniref:NAD(P)-dependent alcohol dehydrogenase n=1 Tax=Pseudonocardia ailaonensis TaxID=367279 RepID=A0ABN2MHE3_9PSEU